MLKSSSPLLRSRILRHHLKYRQQLSALVYKPVSSTSAPIMNQRPITTAVIFDMGGVVVPSPGRLFLEAETSLNLPRGTILSVILESEKTGDGAWQKLEKGLLTADEFGSAFSKECSNKVGRQVDLCSLIKSFDNIHVQPYPQVVDAIKCIRAEGIKTALMTNNWKVTSGESLIPVDKTLFDVIVESCKLGVRKPDPYIYDVCIKNLAVSPQDVIYLDDIGANLKPAKAVGMRTIRVTDPDQAVRELEKELGFCCRGFAEGTELVPKRLELPLDKLKSYLNWALKIHSKDLPVVRSFKHGQSNPTYFVQYGNKNMVLRKKPPGKLLPSAHAVEREYLVMKALGQHGVPVPKMLGLCEDDSLLGTPFYVMEHVPGRIFKDHLLTDLSPAERRQIYTAMIDTLCKIHSVDISAAGLDNFGKKGSYVHRNFVRWAKQYEASKTHEIPSMNKLMEWIPKHLPPTEKITVIHGDFRLDNLIFHPHKPEVVGVLDWELSTIGDPITDLATSCLAYFSPEEFPLFPAFTGLNLPELGIPTLDQVLAEYCQRMNIPPVHNWDFYVAFTFFRFAAILAGVYKRAISGQASAPDAEIIGSFAEKLADVGWRIASNSKLQPTGVAAAASTGGGGRRQYSTLSRNTDSASTVSSMNRSLSTEAGGGSDCMPVSVRGLSPRVQDLHNRVKAFIKEYIVPFEAEYTAHSLSSKRWEVMPKQEELKAKAKAAALWNLFLPRESDPDGKFGAGLSNLEYAFLCEEMGKFPLSSEVFNCSAPDTGNMEVLVRYGTEEQKQKWLTPLLNGEIRSCFAMTEPAVASSDATNIQSSIERNGDHYVINGRKWWTSGVLDPRCKICIFMGKTDPQGDRHRQQSMVLVPMDTPGIKIVRALTVIGLDDPPAGHGEVLFENVRVPVSNLLLGEGRGFEIAQGRLGPGRIHHCMRLIGNAERALELMLERTQNRIAFGKPLAAQGTIQADVAKSRIEIDQTRLLVLKAAFQMDHYGNKVAAPEIAMIKVATPNMAARVIDRAIQAFGGAGLNHDLPLAAMYASARTLRIADGPDEVHMRSVARIEYMRANKSKL